MKNLLYISPLSQNSQTGGANAVNYHTYKELQKYFECTYVQINPKEPLLGKWQSQLRRKLLKRPGRFNFFSQKRLKRIAKEFNAIEGHFDYIFFRGFTPWLLCKPKMPYVTYNDVHFLQFFHNTFSYQQFLQSDIVRICSQEKEWLSKARSVFFESQWGATQCHLDYSIDASNLMNIGRGGNIPIPNKDQYKGNYNLVIIANNFYQKGGDLVFAALQQLQAKYPQLKLHIVGGDPGHEVKAHRVVVYHGYLYKERPEDLKKLTNILSKAFLLMHITREDVNPLVPTEAGYFGCPTITVNQFALPELVQHQKTGILLPYLPSPEDISKAVSALIEDQNTYKTMREATWQFNRNQYSWQSIGAQLKEIIETK